MKHLDEQAATPSGAPPPDDGTAAAMARVRSRGEAFRKAEALEARRSRRISWLRLATFLGVVGALLVVERGGPDRAGAALLAAGVLSLLFLVLLARHMGIRRRERHQGALAAVNEEALLRIRRAWNSLPEEPWGAAPTEAPEAEDLYLLGRASLLRLLGPPATVPGRETLTRWLLEGALPAEVLERQEAVRILAPLDNFRDELSARGRTLDPGNTREVERFLAWAEGDAWLSGRGVLRVVAVFLPLVTLGLGWAYLQGVLAPFWVLPLLATTVLASRTTKPIHARYDAASAGESGVRRYDRLLALLQELPAGSPLLTRIRDGVSGGGNGASAHDAIRSLRRILDAADVRRSMLGPALQWVLLWDVHILGALEGWQARYGGAVRGWLAALGEAEALAALARLSRNHPAWCFPTMVPLEESRGTGPRMVATALGHPLLPPEQCVRNDVEVGPPGTLLLITGSNMSGKSTLLRALGANAALAGAGGPVCAEALVLPPLRLATCMRIQDALDEGISLFMAELHRLREVVERARSTPGTGRVLLYLLDEMLQGTNTAERQVAARRILGHLLEAGAIGAVTTHDLALADTPGMAARAVPVHFRETVEAGPEGQTTLHFDFRLRPGPATSRNALRLLDAVGLGDEPDGEETRPRTG